MRNFRNYQVWQDSIVLAREIYSITTALPSEEKFGLVAQMRRSVVSIPSNIAEGCSRSSEKEFKRFIEVALGSSFELETQTLLAYELQFLFSDVFAAISDRICSIQKQLGGLRNQLNR